MNKKEYIKPAVLKVKNVYPTHIICGSGGERAKIQSGNEFESSDHTKTVNFASETYEGIWGE